ncbi:hypothetical protein A1Q2_02260 [Trichosporon asahii var. asahii CBS 8904]|uniref:Uncharacterized protein n=1 Tax=Trichosporon asahii var. asahii (strain CBS 8904) TaxID=1220162 RepID=K1W3I5_TRIAC|nr:hypothetical protein A1Q2_02260 [Trichosporon asahii var. asahii CBS 8904]
MVGEVSEPSTKRRSEPEALDAAAAKRAKTDADKEAEGKMEIDEEVSAPQFEKGKAKDSTTAEKKADRQAGIKLPIEIIGRVFDFYYDLVHDGRQLDSFAWDEEAALDCRLPELVSRCPHLWSLSLLDVPVFKGFDAVVILETLRLAACVKKLHLELQLMNLAIEAPGHLLNAAERCSRPDRTVVGSMSDPADVIQPFGIEGQARDFRARPDEMSEWWSSVLNEQTCDGQRADMTPRALAQRPRYVANGAYPNPVPDEPASEDWEPYVPPELELPEFLKTSNGEWDVDAITKAEYAAMMAVVYCRDTGKRQAAARWLSDRPLYAVTGRTFEQVNEAEDFSGLPINLHDARKHLALKLRWRLLDHLRAHTPESLYLVFKDPAAACIAHEPWFWQSLPVPHVRMRIARGMDPDDAFSLESLATCVPARELRLSPPSSGGTGGGTVTFWKTTTSRRVEAYPLHPRTCLELVCNTAKDLEGLKVPEGVTVLLGEGDQNWRAVEPGVPSRAMSEEERERLVQAYREDYKRHFGGPDEYVSYGMVDEHAGPGEWGSDSDPGPWAEFGHEDDEIIGTPPPDSDDEANDIPEADGAAAGVATGAAVNGEPTPNGAGGGGSGSNVTAPPQPLLLPIQVHLQQEVQTLLHQFMAQMAHEEAQMATQRQARLATHNQFVQRVQELQAQLAAVEAMELTPGQAAAQAAAQDQLLQVQQAVAQNQATGGPAAQGEVLGGLGEENGGGEPASAAEQGTQPPSQPPADDNGEGSSTHP